MIYANRSLRSSVGFLLHRWLALPVRLSRRGLRYVSKRFREWQLGIDTERPVDDDELGYGPERFGYQPVPYGLFDFAMQLVEVIPGQDVFVDYGCGKGRATILAAMRPFRRVIGVEYSRELCRVARENVRKVRRRLARTSVDIVEADATQYALPDDATVLMFFNPFDADVMAQVLERVRASLDRRPRRLTVLHILPAVRTDLVIDCQWLNRDVDLMRPWSEWERVIVYRSEGGLTAGKS